MARSDLGELGAGFVTAVRTLTVLPLPGRDARQLSDALPWFPVVGAVVGAIALASARAIQALSAGEWLLGAAVMALISTALVTRGLHLDGLADVADGLGGARERERALEIMKDSRIGAFGVIALVLLLLLKLLAIARILATCSSLWLVVAAVLSRTVMVELAARLPYARPTGGTGRAFVEGARRWHRGVAWALALVAAVALLGVAGIVMAVGAALVTLLLGRWFETRLGGVTGDVLGASCELTETALLLLGALAGSPLASWTAALSAGLLWG